MATTGKLGICNDEYMITGIMATTAKLGIGNDENVITGIDYGNDRQAGSRQ